MVDQGTLSRCLRGTSYPVHKDVFVRGAAGNACPSEAIIALLELPERDYASERDVLCQLGDTAYCSPESPASAALEGRASSYAAPAPEAAAGRMPVGAPAVPPGTAKRSTAIVLIAAALIAAAIVVWLVTSAVVAR